MYKDILAQLLASKRVMARQSQRPRVVESEGMGFLQRGMAESRVQQVSADFLKKKKKQPYIEEDPYANIA